MATQISGALGQEKGTEPELVSEVVSVQTSTIDLETLTPEDDRRILRRIDLFLLPVMTISHFWCSLDKSTLAQSSLLGIRQDLGMVGQDYSWASSIYHFGILAATYPASVLLVKLPVGKFLSATTVVWSVVLLTTAATQNTAGILAARFFLGFTEAVLQPGLIAVIAMYYKTEEQPLRLGIWFLGNIVANIVGSFVAYGLVPVMSFSPWRIMFLSFGGATFLWGAVMVFLLPDTPMTGYFLAKEDRLKAVLRVRENRTGIKSQVYKNKQFIEALCDPAAWLLVLFVVGTTIFGGGVAAFLPLVIRGMGFSTLNTYLLQMVVVLVSAVSVLAATAAASYLKNARTLIMAVCYLIGLAGLIMVRQLPASMRAARFGGICLASIFTPAVVLAFSLSASNVGGFTKKNTVNGMIFIATCVGNIVGPQIFLSKEAPTYQSGFLGNIICIGASLFFVLALRIYYAWENSRRDRMSGMSEGMPARREQRVDARALMEMDRTDREITEFRYVY